jgi:hypothetical protein
MEKEGDRRDGNGPIDTYLRAEYRCGRAGPTTDRYSTLHMVEQWSIVGFD